jgi:low affinity Fe/Cu permease
MTDMNSMVDRCMDMMRSMMGGGMMFVVVLLVPFVWVIGLAAVSTSVF